MSIFNVIYNYFYPQNERLDFLSTKEEVKAKKDLCSYIARSSFKENQKILKLYEKLFDEELNIKSIQLDKNEVKINRNDNWKEMELIKILFKMQKISEDQNEKVEKFWKTNKSAYAYQMGNQKADFFKKIVDIYRKVIIDNKENSHLIEKEFNYHY